MLLLHLLQTAHSIKKLQVFIGTTGNSPLSPVTNNVIYILLLLFIYIAMSTYSAASTGVSSRLQNSNHDLTITCSNSFGKHITNQSSSTESNTRS